MAPNDLQPKTSIELGGRRQPKISIGGKPCIFPCMMTELPSRLFLSDVRVIDPCEKQNGAINRSRDEASYETAFGGRR